MDELLVVRKMRVIVNGKIGHIPDFIADLFRQIRHGVNMVVPEFPDPGFVRLINHIFGADLSAPYRIVLVASDLPPDMVMQPNIRVIRSDPTKLFQSWREGGAPKFFLSAGTRGGVGKTMMSIGVAMRARMSLSVSSFTVVDADPNRTLSKQLEEAFGVKKDEINVISLSKLGKGKQSGSTTMFLVSPIAMMEDANQLAKVEWIRNSLAYAILLPSDVVIVDLPGQKSEAIEMIEELMGLIRSRYRFDTVNISLAIMAYATQSDIKDAIDIARHTKVFASRDSQNANLSVGIFLHYGADDRSVRSAIGHVRANGADVVDLIHQVGRLPIRQWDLPSQIKEFPLELSSIANEPDGKAWIGKVGRFFPI